MENPVPTGKGNLRFRLTTTYHRCPANSCPTNSQNQLDPIAVVIPWRPDTRACDSCLTGD
jgi:hypothetical protein